MLEDVVVVDTLFDKPALGHQEIHRCSCGIRSLEERTAVADVDDSPLRLDARMRPDDLQVEDDSTGDNCLMESAKDVHHVLIGDSSECPREQRDVESGRRDLDVDGRGDAISHPPSQRARQRGARRRHGGLIGIESQHARSMLGDAARQPAVATAHLEDARAGEVLQPAQRRQMRSFGIEHARHFLSLVDTKSLVTWR